MVEAIDFRKGGEDGQNVHLKGWGVHPDPLHGCGLDSPALDRLCIHSSKPHNNIHVQSKCLHVE